MAGHLLRNKALRLLAPCLLLAGALGCGQGDRELAGRVPVEGQVLVGGAPLTTGSVVFRPDASRGNHSKHEPHGIIGGNGKYRMVTATLKGAPPGWYKVGVIATVPSDPGNPYAYPTPIIPTRYANPEMSGLSLEVVKRPEAGRYNLNIEDR